MLGVLVRTREGSGEYLDQESEVIRRPQGAHRVEVTAGAKAPSQEGKMHER